MDHRSCRVPECLKPPRSAKADLCKMHYHRQYRHGSVDALAHREAGPSLGRRYVSVYRPGHPLARSGKVYEHRAALYDHIGPGPHPCHWCTAPVDWVAKGQPGCLQVDHLNNDGRDNRLDNLVPCCQSCNSARGSQRRHDALRERGYWSQHDTVGRLGTRTTRVEDRAA